MFNIGSQNGVIYWIRAVPPRKIQNFPHNFQVTKPSPTNFETQENFEKIYNKYIPLRSFDCLELACRALYLVQFS